MQLKLYLKEQSHRGHLYTVNQWQESNCSVVTTEMRMRMRKSEDRGYGQRKGQKKDVTYLIVWSQKLKEWFSENDTDSLQMLLDIYEWVAWNTEENLVRGNCKWVQENRPSG